MPPPSEFFSDVVRSSSAYDVNRTYCILSDRRTNQDHDSIDGRHVASDPVLPESDVALLPSPARRARPV